jgi:NDP-sugar pyrophosphorylase family protein
MSYKVVIPSAGLGSRIGHHTKFINKALVTIGDKPAISRVIDKFALEIPLVILLGYKGDMIREVLLQLYPNRDITFVDVDLYEGKGSGLGYTLCKAEEHLQCPFIFIPNDTITGEDIIDLDPRNHGNWAAYYQKTDIDNYNPETFRTLILSKNEDKVVGITGKGTLNFNIYIGICGVNDYADFWKAMKSNDAIEAGEVIGLRALNYTNAVRINEWYDSGSLQNLEIAKEKFQSAEHNILEKEDEAIWFSGDDVLKFSIHKNFISDRVERLKYLPKYLMPNLLDHGKYTYKYRKVKGKVIADTLTANRMRNLLDMCNSSMWSNNVEVSDEAKNVCYEFYRDKTYSRLDYYLDRFEQYDDVKTLNGIKVDSVRALLEKVDWEELCESPHWSTFHGDFHGENIIADEKGGFTLLDWRQCFGKNSKKHGDAYYDLAKFRHGLLVNHGVVNANDFTINELAHNYVFISIKQHSNLLECDNEFNKWLIENSFNPKKVKLLTALIYLNICGLHDYPYAKFLYLYGQHLLSEFLTDN